MKTLLSFIMLLALVCFTPIFAQQQYSVDGTTYTLKTEVEGTITLLWNTINGEYRYFAKKGAAITELKNSRNGNGYQYEYRESLQLLTIDAPTNTDKVKLTTASLRNFFNDYNKKMDPNYEVSSNSILLKTRLGVFGGISNSIFTDNPDNILLPVAGVDFEILDEVKLKRHSLVIRFKQTFENSDYKYSASQFSMNYRFKIIKTETFDIFTNVKIVTLTFVNKEVEIISMDPMGGTTTAIESISGSDFGAPATFGVGADVALGNGYLTFSYNDIFAIGIDSNGEFPVDLTIGYKFNL